MIKNEYFRIELCENEKMLWAYHDITSERSYNIGVPQIEVDGSAIALAAQNIVADGDLQTLSNGCLEQAYHANVKSYPDLLLRVVFRFAPDNPTVRFSYSLHSRAAHRLTKTQGRDCIAYLSLDLSEMPQVKEVHFSEFRETVHSFCLSELAVGPEQFENGLSLMGPMVVAGDGERSLLLAYEHGSQVPDAFVEFALHADRAVVLQGVKGNYYAGQKLTEEAPFETIWFQFAALAGGEKELSHAYRDFVLKYQSLNTQSRKPYIFYNTWAYQERNKHWNGKTFLASMHQQRILDEIEVAYRMGVEVFVLDTGWYQKTGDWQVDTNRFPDGLRAIKAKLDSYGMQLGLWFDPCAAAVSSAMLQGHADCTISWRGKTPEPHAVWETEASHRMCLASRYSEAFADELIRLVREVGVTYFKWDAIHQYGCDDPNHQHGNEDNSSQERADCYAFENGRAMIRVVDKLCRECPQAIVDFDITEGQRFVGLGFLAAGKYFLINNGPYYGNYDIPVPPEQWINIFVYPGAARTRICREPLTFDKWIPSVLFLTHYLPDEPASSQLVNIASLILGQNGIWGDLLTVSEQGVEQFHKLLGLYKQVRDDITLSSPVCSGVAGGSPEIHEKINPANGRGAVVVFTAAPGTYCYVTSNSAVQQFFALEGVSVAFDDRQRAVLTLTFTESGAKVVFFGADVEALAAP
jgi:alpha-galactosidase